MTPSTREVPRQVPRFGGVVRDALATAASVRVASQTLAGIPRSSAFAASTAHTQQSTSSSDYYCTRISLWLRCSEGASPLEDRRKHAPRDYAHPIRACQHRSTIPSESSRKERQHNQIDHTRNLEAIASDRVELVAMMVRPLWQTDDSAGSRPTPVHA